jgi:hypothetical protein
MSLKCRRLSSVRSSGIHCATRLYSTLAPRQWLTSLLVLNILPDRLAQQRVQRSLFDQFLEDFDDPVKQRTDEH